MDLHLHRVHFLVITNIGLKYSLLDCVSVFLVFMVLFILHFIIIYYYYLVLLFFIIFSFSCFYRVCVLCFMYML